MLDDAFKEDKLEELMIANWTRFLDSSKLLAYVLQTVNKNINNFAMISNSNITPKGVSITLSRCNWTPQGFILWAEFSVPIAKDKSAEGTMELLLSYDGSITHLYTTGNIFCKN